MKRPTVPWADGSSRRAGVLSVFAPKKFDSMTRFYCSRGLICHSFLRPVGDH